MNRLIKSSNFWNAIIASALLFAACKFQCNEITDYIFFLFAGRTAVTGIKDYVRAKDGREFDKSKGTYQKVDE